MIVIPSYLDAVAANTAFNFVPGQLSTAQAQNTLQQGIYSVMGDIQSNIVSEAALIRGELNANSTTLANEIITSKTETISLLREELNVNSTTLANEIVVLQSGLSELSTNKVDKAITLAGYGITDAINVDKLGVANGVCTLGADAKVPAVFLPSYVDDTVEYPNYVSLPATGESSKIYVTLDDNKMYRWSGSTYIFLDAHAGTADAATRLATPRTINGVSFDGTENISFPVGELTQANENVASFTAVSNKAYMIGANTLTVTLPANPVSGDKISLYDTLTTCTSLTLDGNGKKVNGASSKLISYSGFKLEVLFVNATKGWLVFNCAID